MTRVKICGMTSVEDAVFALECGADAVGFVFSASPRKVLVSQACLMSSKLPPFASRAGVFVDETAEFVKEVMEAVRLDVLQFHGNETREYCAHFMRSGKVVKAFRMNVEGAAPDAADFPADAYLLDSGTARMAGGTGETFRWSLADGMKKNGKPIILAGGLNPANVGEAIKAVRPYAVDVSTGVESSPGRKDRSLVRAFVQKVKEADKYL